MVLAATGAALCSAGALVAPDSRKLRMSFLVTRPLRPVPSSRAMSTPCSWAILRTSGLDLARRSSSAVVVALPPLPVADAVADPGSVFLDWAGAGSVLGAGFVESVDLD